ncbi:MAG: TonB box-like protein [Candidatus Magasanikbacteria bacterium GW2011_GWA2_56_11]|uniref:TonB box-like protein n=1 Tax=Candidatus Magasanikbacteria bacterium GW2011_GWA2_56_11 TaxID=1619044 RepID=A0A0G1YFN7_9BACT|nr:MAG: TonB box-like protein [Candidatus Magasanikbacteria bacterium GW2011_GWA2_56_11]
MDITPGIYRHYRGGLYRLHRVATHSESEEPMVLYEALYDTDPKWRWCVRPLKMFSEEVELPDGQKVPRFAEIKEQTPENMPEIKCDVSNLVRLFSLLQLTKEQPLTGYLTAGLKLSQTATLAEHHYTTALSAYFIAREIERAGGQINVSRLVIMALIHDLGELFGGDISGPLNRRYPDLREAKDRIAERAIDLLGGYLEETGREELKALWEEFEHGDSDEAVIGKIMDQMDHQFYLEHYCYRPSAGADYRSAFVDQHILVLTAKIKDPATKHVMDNFLSEFKTNFFGRGFEGLALLMK